MDDFYTKEQFDKDFEAFEEHLRREHLVPKYVFVPEEYRDLWERVSQEAKKYIASPLEENSECD